MDLKKNSQECFLGGPLPNLLKSFRSAKQNGRHSKNNNNNKKTTTKKKNTHTKTIFKRLKLLNAQPDLRLHCPHFRRDSALFFITGETGMLSDHLVPCRADEPSRYVAQLNPYLIMPIWVRLIYFRQTLQNTFNIYR